MLLYSQNLKFSKAFAKNLQKPAKKKTKASLKFFDVAVKIDQPALFGDFQLDSFVKFLKRFLKKDAQFFLRVNSAISITKKAKDTRLGCGKGPVKYHAFNLKKSTVLLEISTNRKRKRILFILRKSFSKISAKCFIFVKKQR